MDTSLYDNLGGGIMRLADYFVLRPPPFPYRVIVDDALARRLLPSRMEPRGRVWSKLGLVGAGMLLGAGVVVMADPRMRAMVRDRLRRSQPVRQG